MKKVICGKNPNMNEYFDSSPLFYTESSQRSRELTCLLERQYKTKLYVNFLLLKQIEPPVDLKESFHVLGIELNRK